MRRRPVAIAAIAVLSLLLASTTSQAAEGSSAGQRWFKGVRVMPGGAVAGDRIVYEGGAVIVVPVDDIIDSFDTCTSGWVCLFENVNWTGAMVAFRTCCAWNNLSGYGFDNAASSWRNRLGVDAQIAKDSGGGGDKLCLGNGAYSSSMPSGWDNTASSLRVRDASTYC